MTEPTPQEREEPMPKAVLHSPEMQAKIATAKARPGETGAGKTADELEASLRSLDEPNLPSDAETFESMRHYPGPLDEPEEDTPTEVTR